MVKLVIWTTNPSIPFPEAAILECEKSENSERLRNKHSVLSNFSPGGNFFHCLGIRSLTKTKILALGVLSKKLIILQLIFSIFQTKRKMLAQISALLGIKQVIWGQLSEIFLEGLFLCFCCSFSFFSRFQASLNQKLKRDFMKHKSVLVKNNLILHSNFSTSKYRW